MTLAEAAGGRSINFVLSGIIIGIAISSLTTILIVSSQDAQLHGALSWLFGSFAFISWNEALLIIIPVLLLSVIILMYARELNVILLGDEHARHLGLEVRAFKRMTVLIVSVLTAVSVAFCGIIAFLGLIVPHTARMLVGGDHRLLIPASMVLGANCPTGSGHIFPTGSASERAPHRCGHLAHRRTVLHLSHDQKGEGICRMNLRYPSASRASSSAIMALTS